MADEAALLAAGADGLQAGEEYFDVDEDEGAGGLSHEDRCDARAHIETHTVFLSLSFSSSFLKYLLCLAIFGISSRGVRERFERLQGTGSRVCSGCTRRGFVLNWSCKFRSACACAACESDTHVSL